MRTVKRYDVDTMDGALVTSVGPPPVREYQPITPESTDMIGARVVLAQPTTWWVDMRAVTEPIGSAGDWVIGIVDEAEWYAAGQQAQRVPSTAILTVPLREVWAE